MKMKKVKAVLAAFALIAMMPFQVMAADGSIMFSDLTEETGRSVKTGETAEIKFAVASTAGAIGEANVTLTYDASALQFEGAEGVTEGSEKGSLVYTGKGDGTVAELRTTLKFKVLKAGDLSIHVASYQVASSVGAQLTEVETGSSAITALPGETEVAEQTGSEQQGQTTGEAIEISDTYKITLLTEKPDTEQPENYVDTELTLNGKSFRYGRKRINLLITSSMQKTVMVKNSYISMIQKRELTRDLLRRRQKKTAHRESKGRSKVCWKDI